MICSLHMQRGCSHLCTQGRGAHTLKDYAYGILLLELTIFHYYIVVVACEYFNIVFI